MICNNKIYDFKITPTLKKNVINFPGKRFRKIHILIYLMTTVSMVYRINLINQNLWKSMESRNNLALIVLTQLVAFYCKNNRLSLILFICC